MKSESRLHLIDVRHTYQTVPKERGEEYQQFAVRACLSDGKLKVTFDLHGPGGPIEGLEPELLELIQAAVEMVRSQVRQDEFYEQKE